MRIVTIPAGLLETNCYLVYLEEKHRLYVIDPGGDAPEIIDAAHEFPFSEARILLTHAHIDHIAAAGEVAKALKIDRASIGAPDQAFYRSPENALPPWLPAAKNLPAPVDFGEEEDFRVLPLPGHTPGGRGLLFGTDCFVGDTIFAGSVGRTDLPGGDTDTLLESIKTRILTLPDSTRLYPGHGPATTVARERAANPYLQDL